MLEEVDHIKYLESQIDKEGGVEVDVSFRMGEANRGAGTVKKFVEEWRSGSGG